MPSRSIDASTILSAGACAVAPSLLVSGVLAAVGFTGGGVAYGSLAAMWMSSLGNVPAGSLFAALQSTGAIGLTGVLLSPTAIAVESATFVSVIYGMKRHSIDASKINDFASTTSAHLWSAKQRFAGYAQDYLHSHPEVAERVHSYRQSAQAHMSPYLSSINSHSTEAIKVLDEKTRIPRENLIRSTNNFLTSINSQETADLVRKHSKEGLDKARICTENAINAANSYISTINTQENRDFINQKSQEVLQVLDEHTRVHRENLMRSTSSFISNMNSQETADLVRKHSKEGAEKAVAVTQNAINAANSYLSTINTQENRDLINKKSQEAFQALEEQTRVHRENLMRNANSYFTGLFRQ